MLAIGVPEQPAHLHYPKIHNRTRKPVMIEERAVGPERWTTARMPTVRGILGGDRHVSKLTPPLHTRGAHHSDNDQHGVDPGESASEWTAFTFPHPPWGQPFRTGPCEGGLLRRRYTRDRPVIRHGEKRSLHGVQTRQYVLLPGHSQWAIPPLCSTARQDGAPSAHQASCVG